MTAVCFRSASKSYPVYRSPVDRLKELATLNRGRFHDDFWALRDVSFEAEKGSIFCLIGENGSGKSTALQLAAGVFPPTEGAVEVQGRTSALLELGAGFNPEFSGRENVFLYGTLLGLSHRQIRQRYGEIERFAEIGNFINEPVKTYSSGMMVRLAFAVAIYVEPEVLVVDEALAVGDYYFRQRCLRKVEELRKHGTTILLVSHSMADVKALGTAALWLRHGSVAALGTPETVVPRYLASMAKKDAAYRSEHPQETGAAPDSNNVAPEIVESIPNIDFRRGNQAAEIIGIAVLDDTGQQTQLMEPAATMIVRISVWARRRIDSPNVGFIVRNHVGLDFAGTNTSREGLTLPPMEPGDIYTVDFHLDVPELYPGNFSFSPAISDGLLEDPRLCDWIDNALTLQMAHRGRPTYGYVHLPCRIVLNGRLNEPQPSHTSISPWKS